MSIGKLRNRYCPCGSNKKYKKCHWDADYWKDFAKSDYKITIQEKLHGKIVSSEKHIVSYRRTP